MISSLELARLCGVSQGTVDRALHGRAGISTKTKERILRVASEHGYQANPAATEMMHGRSVIVGGIVPSFNSVFFADLFQTIAMRLRGNGLRLHVCSYEDAASFVEILTDFAARKCAGAVIVAPMREPFAIAPPVIASMPIVSLLSTLSGKAIPGVHPDEHRCGYDATRGLIGRGHRSIVMLDYAFDTPAVAARAAGYEHAMRDAGLSSIRLRKPDRATLLETINARRATAVFCHNDWLALETIRQLHAAGLSVPGDLSVLGVDNSPTFTALCDEVTTMQYPFTDIADHVAAILRGTPLGRPVEPCKWVERGSVRAV